MIYNQGFGGGMKPKIIVTAPTGTVVTATKGTTVITAGESGGKYVILADDYGVWTVTGTKGSQSVSQDVNVVAVDTYEVTLDFTPKVLNDATWEQIRDVADASTGPNYWSVGDTKQITINGKLSDDLTLSNYSIWVYIIGFDHNASAEGTGIAFQGFKTAQTGGIDVALVEVNYEYDKTSGQYFNMNNNNSTLGGWASCDMRNNTLPVVKAALPTKLTSVIKTTSIYTDNTGGSNTSASYVTSSSDNLYLLAEFEVFGARTYANAAEQNYQQQYAYYASGNSKNKYKYNATTTLAYWWERSPCAGSSANFCIVGSDSSTGGTAYSYTAKRLAGLAPAFKVGSNPPPQPIGALAVGSSVFLKTYEPVLEYNVDTEFVIVHQGNPDSSIYDSSCDGTWLLKKTLYENTEKWDTNNVNNFATSHMNTWLNNTYFNQIVAKDIIKKVNLPYLPGGTASSIQNMETSVFLLGLVEVGADSSTDGWSTMPVDGAKLDYFTANVTDPSGAAEKRKVATRTGGTAYWWLRSPLKTSTGNVWNVNPNGYFDGTFSAVSGNSSIRPAFILPFDTQVDFQGNIVI